MQYEMNNFNYFDTLVRFLRAQPINLAGITAPSGGQGGGAGYIGYLPQTRVAYDETEAATQDTAVSGSLLDNLNHIRYQITTLSGIAAGGVIVKDDGVIVASGVTVIDFINDFEVLEPENNQVTVALVAASGIVSLSGVHNEDLSSQISGPTTHFDTTNIFYPGYLRVYYNGLRQDNGIITDPDYGGFSTDFTVVDGDAVVVDYDVAISGGGGTQGHSHTQYVTLAYLEGNYYDAEAIALILDQKADVIHTHTESDITDLVHDATSLQGTAISGIAPAAESVLQYNATDDVWTPTSLSGVLARTIHQQAVFSVEGANLAAADVGIKPLRIYVHEVGFAGQFEEIFCAVGTAPGATDLHINVLKNGSTIFNSPEYLTLPVGSGYAVRADFVDDQVAKDDYLQFQLVQGDAAAANLTVHVRFKWEAT
jgi:hypothetical protein